MFHSQEVKTQEGTSYGLQTGVSTIPFLFLFIPFVFLHPCIHPFWFLFIPFVFLHFCIHPFGFLFIPVIFLHSCIHPLLVSIDSLFYHVLHFFFQTPVWKRKRIPRGRIFKITTQPNSLLLIKFDLNVPLQFQTTRLCRALKLTVIV